MFAIGIIGIALLAVPVLAESPAYALTELTGIADSLDAKTLSARQFYGTIAATTLAGPRATASASTRRGHFIGRRS